MASGVSAHTTTVHLIVFSLQYVVSTFLQGLDATEAGPSPVRGPPGARRGVTPPSSVSEVSNTEGERVRRLAEASPSAEEITDRMIQIEKQLKDLVAFRYAERCNFRQFARMWFSEDAFCTQHLKRKDRMILMGLIRFRDHNGTLLLFQRRCHSACGIPSCQVPLAREVLKQRYKQQREEKERDLNAWAACLDALNFRIKLLDNERKDLENKLTEEQYVRFLVKLAGRGEGDSGGESTRALSGEADESASTSQSSDVAGSTPGGSDSLEALQREIPLARQEAAQALKKRRYWRNFLRTHEAQRPQGPTAEMLENERVDAACDFEKWQTELAELKARSSGAEKVYAALRARVRSLHQRRRAIVKKQKTGSQSGTKGTGTGTPLKGSWNARNRFARFDIVVEESDAQTPWRTRPSCAFWSQRTSGQSAAAGLQPGPAKHHVLLSARPYMQQRYQKPRRKPRKPAVSSEAERGGGGGAEPGPSTSTSGLNAASALQENRSAARLMRLTSHWRQ
ncbi:hypothetical protein NCLIV_017220 [Neospora caninum Liverpool]|uniref:Uncharacterized protein n=1 Tax=Neospora caninum (strain Liverpool) TaxID=572307 RepID=F0VDY7_NEOCL|nr:hypothetical protein NCLIV_017220 [Neospora caninum Liverpool]CBZ51930.1 hypothetical protein NCLIV_017220 [Neospora caninum Liverpool]|eukprot:XP_003881963.1 hypothetical protein NCLIV_017220 [Neospora caninum Liverpool]